MFSDTWHTLFGLLIIALSCFGVAINCVALVILSRKKRQSAFNELLVILSVYDILVVLCGTLSYGFPNVSKDYNYYVLPRQVKRSDAGIVDTSPNISANLRAPKSVD